MTEQILLRLKIWTLDTKWLMQSYISKLLHKSQKPVPSPANQKKLPDFHVAFSLIFWLP
jgi:hypothetical protein